MPRPAHHSHLRNFLGLYGRAVALTRLDDGFVSHCVSERYDTIATLTRLLPLVCDLFSRQAGRHACGQAGCRQACTNAVSHANRQTSMLAGRSVVSCNCDATSVHLPCHRHVFSSHACVCSNQQLSNVASHTTGTYAIVGVCVPHHNDLHVHIGICVTIVFFSNPSVGTCAIVGVCASPHRLVCTDRHLRHDCACFVNRVFPTNSYRLLLATQSFNFRSFRSSPLRSTPPCRPRDRSSCAL